MLKPTRKKRAPKIKETNMYDWIPGQEGIALIYTGRKQDSDVDPGVWRSSKGTKEDTLLVLLRAGKLEGKALLDAIELDIDLSTGSSPGVV